MSVPVAGSGPDSVGAAAWTGTACVGAAVGWTCAAMAATVIGVLTVRTLPATLRPVRVRVCEPMAKPTGTVKVPLTSPTELAIAEPSVTGSDWRVTTTSVPGFHPVERTVRVPPGVTVVGDTESMTGSGGVVVVVGATAVVDVVEVELVVLVLVVDEVDEVGATVDVVVATVVDVVVGAVVEVVEVEVVVGIVEVVDVDVVVGAVVEVEVVDVEVVEVDDVEVELVEVDDVVVVTAGSS